jgi:hypothetical protein
MPRNYLTFGDIEGKLEGLRARGIQADREIRPQSQHDEVEGAA